MARIVTAAASRLQAFETPQNLGTYERIAPPRALLLPLAFTAALSAFSLLPVATQNSHLFWSIVGSAGLLLAWNAVLLVVSATRHRTLTLEIVLRKQHYLQACAQGSVLLYWGWYW